MGDHERWGQKQLRVTQRVAHLALANAFWLLVPASSLRQSTVLLHGGAFTRLRENDENKTFVSF